MAAYTPSALSLLTNCFSSEAMERTARRTGFVTRASPIPGKRFLALVTFGGWRAPHTTVAPLAAQATPGGTHVEVAPAAMHQRLHKRAPAFLQAMLRPALAKVHALEKGCAEGLCTCLPQVSLADSPGCGRPESLHGLVPASGGRATKAGAKIPAGWA